MAFPPVRGLGFQPISLGDTIQLITGVVLPKMFLEQMGGALDTQVL